MFKTDLLNDQGSSLFIAILFGMVVTIGGVASIYSLVSDDGVPSGIPAQIAEVQGK